MTQTAANSFSEPTVEELIKLVQSKAIALPDFQREYVWKPPAVKALLASIVVEYPIGSLLALAHDSSNQIVSFLNPIGVESGPAYDAERASMLLLDGQQRVTSLFHALTGAGPHHYFVDVDAFQLAVGSGDPEQIVAAIKHLPNPDHPDGRAANKKLWRQWTADPKALRVPFLWLGRVLRDPSMDFADFLDEMEDRDMKSKLKPLRQSLVRKLENCKVPIIWLKKDTAPEALCGVFESINKHGVSLGVFDLKVASLFAKGFNLKDSWRCATEKFSNIDRFEIDNTHVLWAVSLLSNGRCAKADILRRTTEKDFEKHWEPVCQAFDKVLGILESDCGVMGPRFLCYPPALASMAAAYCTLNKSQRKSEVVLKRLCTWFWCTVFSRRYVEGAQSNATADFVPLRDWLAGGAVPDVVSAFRFDSSGLSEAQSGTSALFQAVIALLVSRSPKSFLSGEDVRYAVPKVDVHHIFPEEFLASRKPQAAKPKVNCIINKTFITATDNRTILALSPSVYLRDMQKRWSTDASLAKMLATHFIDQDARAAMENDDFDEFLRRREISIVQAIEAVTRV